MLGFKALEISEIPRAARFRALEEQAPVAGTGHEHRASLNELGLTQLVDTVAVTGQNWIKIRTTAPNSRGATARSLRRLAPRRE